MATKKNVNKTFNVTGRVTVDVGIDISAQDITEAVEKAKELKIEDFVVSQGDTQDYKGPDIRSVWINDAQFL